MLDPKDRPDGKMFRLGPVVIENSRGKILHQGVSSEPEIIDLLGKMIELGNREDVPTSMQPQSAIFSLSIFTPSMTVTGEREVSSRVEPERDVVAAYGVVAL